MPPQYTIPPSTRAVGTGNPPADMNGAADALTAMGAAGNVLNAAYAGGADPTGAADSTTAIQAAINAAAYVSASDASGILGAAQATVYLPGGTYLISTGPLVLPHGHSLRITGAGDGTILKSTANAIIDFDGLNGLTEGSVEIDHLGFDAAGGHVFQNPNIHGQLHLHDLAIRQRSAGFSVFWADDTVTGASTGLYQAIFRNIRYILDPGTRSVEAWHIISGHSDNVTDLTWEHVSGPVPSGYTGNDATMDNTQYQWYVTCTGATGNHASNLTWRNCVMSNPFGGIIKAAATQGITIEGVSAYNTFDRAMTNSLYWLTKDPANNGPVEGAVIRNCVRTTALGSGSTQPPYDVLLDSSAKNILIENMVTGYSPAVTFINAGGASGVVIIQPGGGGSASVPVVSGQAGDTIVIGQGTVAVGTGTTLPANAPDPATHGLKAWAYDPVTSSGGIAGTAGNIYLTQITIRQAVTVTKIWWNQTATGSGGTAAQNYVGLYNSAGTLLASAGTDGNVGSSGNLSATIASQSLTSGIYYVAFLYNATGMPAIARSAAGSSTLGDINIGSAAPRFGSAGTTQTSLPGTATIAQAFVQTYWAALS